MYRYSVLSVRHLPPRLLPVWVCARPLSARKGLSAMHDCSRMTQSGLVPKLAYARTPRNSWCAAFCK